MILLMADDSLPGETEIELVLPDRQEAGDGLAELERLLPLWKQSLALYLEKPDLGLVVAIESVTHDENGFCLNLSVEEALVTPSDFDSKKLKAGCVWNQPYMSMGPLSLTATYAFSLYFGAEAVENARNEAALFRNDPGAQGRKLPVSRLRPWLL